MEEGKHRPSAFLFINPTVSCHLRNFPTIKRHSLSKTRSNDGYCSHSYAIGATFSHYAIAQGIQLTLALCQLAKGPIVHDRILRELFLIFLMVREENDKVSNLYLWSLLIN